MLDDGHFRARLAAFRKITTARGDGGGGGTSIVNIGFPSIARTFHSPIGGAVEWVAASTVPAAAPESVALQHAFLVGFHAALTVAAGLAAVGIFAALVRGDEGPSNHATLQINSSPGPTA